MAIRKETSKRIMNNNRYFHYMLYLIIIENVNWEIIKLRANLKLKFDQADSEGDIKLGYKLERFFCDTDNTRVLRYFDYDIYHGVFFIKLISVSNILFVVC